MKRTAAVPSRAARARGAAALAGLMLAVGAAAACGPEPATKGVPGASASTAAGSSASASPDPSASPSGPGGGSAVPAPGSSAAPAPSGAPSGPGIAPGEPAPTPVKLPATSYQVENGTRLTVYFYGGICDKYGLKADETTAGKVLVRVVITQTAPRGQACPALVRSQAVSADLKQPLGNRKVVDQATDGEVPMGAGAVGGPQ